MEFRDSRLVRAWAPVGEGPIDAAIRARREAGLRVLSLLGNFGQADCPSFSPERFADILSATRQGPYAPDPLGQLAAREAVAEYYVARQWSISPPQLLLTPGTSLGYFYALRILTRPGDDVLVPKPGYPLFDDLCALLGLTARSYHLRQEADQWAFDLEEIAFQTTPRTRAIVIVSPHNPTGNVPGAEALRAVGEFCRARSLALLFDEVFAEYSPAPFVRPQPEDFPLLLVLNGLSKMLALPGAKMAWLAAAGDRQNVRSFMDAAAHLSDTFLPVSELMQGALPKLLREGLTEELPQLQRLVERGRATVREALPQALIPTSGTYFTVPLTNDANDLAIATLIAELGVHVHPGSFYGMPPSVVGTVTNPQESLRMACEVLRGSLFV